MNTDEAKAVIEAALLSAPQPLSIVELRRLFDDALPPEAIRSLLDDLGHAWQARSLRLVELAGGWRFQTAPEFARFLDRLHGEKPPRYSRAVMETLAIIAYRQPVTRGDIEEIRGVMVSAQIVRTLEERGWIEVIGHKDTVGRPALFGTTKKFLEDMGLKSVSQLPALEGASPPELPAQQTMNFDNAPEAEPETGGSLEVNADSPPSGDSVADSNASAADGDSVAPDGPMPFDGPAAVDGVVAMDEAVVIDEAVGMDDRLAVDADDALQVDLGPDGMASDQSAVLTEAQPADAAGGTDENGLARRDGLETGAEVDPGIQQKREAS
jgi:segregation and condensation protein B